MISLFATGDFVRVSIKPGVYRDALGFVGLLMGVDVDSNRTLGLINGEDGQIAFCDINDLTTDFIYDVEKDRFVDRGAEVPSDE